MTANWHVYNVMIMTCTVAITGGAYIILYAMGAALGGLRRRQLGAFATVWCAWEVGQVQLSLL